MRHLGHPRISLCMITKNEEALLHQCVASVRPVVSEVIVVDTGSTDRTVEIATSLGAKVLHHRWEDDFSAPRNLSLTHATGDWILVLDADEAIAECHHSTLYELTKYRHHCYLLTQRHYCNDMRMSGFRPTHGEYPEWEGNHSGYFESALCRFFPNVQDIRYNGRVHELVEHSIAALPKLQLVKCPIIIHHYGHTDSVRARKNKSSIYTPLGTRKISEQPLDWKAHFELGVEHNNNGRLRESVDSFTKALELNRNYLPCWINIGYVLCELGKHSQAEHCLSMAIKLDPRSHEAFCNLGVVYLRTKRLPAAEICFRAAIERDVTYVNAFCNLGKTLAAMGRNAEAANIYFRALEILPTCSTAKSDLAVLYACSGLSPLPPANTSRLVSE